MIALHTGTLRLVLVAALTLCALPALGQEGPVTLAELKGLLQQRADENEILQLLRSTDRFAFTQEDLPALRDAGAGPKLLEGISRILEANAVTQVLTLIEQGRPEDQVVQWILKNTDRRSLTARERLRLVRAKAAPAVLQALERTYVYPGFKAVQDPLGILSAQIPVGWNAHHYYTPEGLKFVFSPEQGVQPNKFKTGFQIQLEFLERTSPYRRPGFDLFAFHERGLSALLQTNKSFDLKPLPGKGAFRTRIAGNQAVAQEFSVTMMGEPCLETLIRVAPENIKFFVEYVAPRAAYDKLKETFEKTLVTLRPFPDRTRPRRLTEPLRAQEALERYREATVQIVTSVENSEGKLTTAGYGSGFFVREDGYVLTNHHVICEAKSHDDCKEDQVYRHVSVQWDDKVPGEADGTVRASVPAQVIDTLHTRSPFVDMAILKVPVGKTPYRTIPISPVADGLSLEGDPVVALGFPLPGLFRDRTIVLTEGRLATITRTQRSQREGLESEFDRATLDITINPGNSGGPCVNLATGAVIGLNTEVPHAFLWAHKDIQRLDYADVSLIDQAIGHFPQILWQPKKGELGAAEHLELAAMLLATGHDRAAAVQLDAAAAGSLKPEQEARLHHQVYLLYERKGLTELAAKELDLALSRHPKLVAALMDKARALRNAGDYDAALLRLDDAIAADPDRWNAVELRAEVLSAANRHDQAIKSLEAALAKWGAVNGDLQSCKAHVLLAMGRPKEALECFRKVVADSPGYFRARIGIAQVLARAQDPAASLREFENLVKDFPDEFEAHEAFGRHLLTVKNRMADGIRELSRAVDASLVTQGRAPKELLRFLGDQAVAMKDHADAGRFAALLLHNHWPEAGGRASAHRLLSLYWEAQGRPGLAAAHHEAWIQGAARLAGLLSPPAKRPSGAPLISSTDVNQLLAAEYTEDLLAEVIVNVNLDFDPPPSTRGGHRVQMAIFLLNNRYILDQKIGGKGLASMVECGRFPGPVPATEKRAAGSLRLKNNGGFPLTGLRLRNVYKDKNQGVLGSVESDFRVPNGCLDPGATLAIPYAFDTWEALKALKIDRAQIKDYAVEIVSARNGTYLKQVRMADTQVSEEGFQFAVVNHSPFQVKSFTVRVEYWVNNAPLADSAGAVRRFEKKWTCDLRPDDRTAPILEAEWTSAERQKSVGIVPGTAFEVRSRVVDATIE